MITVNGWCADGKVGGGVGKRGGGECSVNGGGGERFLSLARNVMNKVIILLLPILRIIIYTCQ